MSLVCLSFSHKHVPIAMREKLHFDTDAMTNACARFRCGQDKPTQILELVILSTCNRTEIYAHTSVEKPLRPGETVANELCLFLAEARGIDPNHLNQTGTWLSGEDVTRHLCRVAAGLESLVLGEPQILGQVGDAMKTGLVMNSCGVVLTKLFQTAIKAGRRARNETQINQHSLNVSTVAVNTAEKELESLEGKTVVLLGAGEMANLALEQLRKKQVGEILVVNRTVYAANELAERHGGKAFVFEQIGQVLAQADIVISSTGAPHTLLTKDMVEAAMISRPSRRLMILDIAVPRDVEVAVEEVTNVVRYDVDDIHMSTGQSAVLRKQQIPEVESIIENERVHFSSWLRSVAVEPTVAELRKKANHLRQAELQRLAALIDDLDESTWAVIERFSKALMNKILHDPTMRLRDLHNSRGAINYTEAIRELFDLARESSEIVDTNVANDETQLPSLAPQTDQGKD